MSYSGSNKHLGAAGHSRFSQADFVPSKTAVTEFDEYRYFGDCLAYEVFSDQYVADGNGKAKINDNPGKGEGTRPARKSLFSAVNTVLENGDYRTALNVPLWDTPDMRETIRQNTKCSIRDLVEASEQGKMGRAVYQYSDFMFCKDLGKMPNNYLVTLRRFPEGCGDHINYTVGDETEHKTQMHAPDIGRMVTWLNTAGNDMENVLQYNYNMPYSELTAKFDDKRGSENSGGMLKNLFQMSDKTYQGQLLQGRVSGGFMSSNGLYKAVDSSKYGKFVTGMVGYDIQSERADFLTQYDKTRTYGPLDVIMKTHKREQGLEFTQKFTLNFDYELRSYDGVNGKAAFLDLLANILCVTYTTGKFWGGARINTGAHQSALYSNLPIWKIDKGSAQDPGSIVDAAYESLGTLWNAGKSKYEDKGLMGILKDLGGGIMNLLVGGMLNKLGRPDKFAYQSLLSDAPVGMWHLTIGNPRNPILSVGNLILNNCTIKHMGPLGIDDFPTQLRVSVELSSAMPRDIVKIEQMYLMGDSRIYTPMSVTGQKVYDNSKRYKNAVGGTTQNGNSNTAAAAQSSVSNIKAETNDSVSQGKSTVHWLTKQFGLSPTDGNVYDLAARAFNAALNGSSLVKDKQTKK